MTEQDRLRCCLRLHLADGVGAVLFARLVEAFGDAEAVFRAGPAEWRRVEGVGDKTAAAIAAVNDEQINEELALAAEHGAAILTAEDEPYPAVLKRIYDPPGVLYVRGRLEAADALAVGIVGARRSSHYGLEQGQRFAELLGRAGFTIVSGGARGIDTAAHRGALAAGGRTIAVMGCGLAQTYPPENDKLFEQIVADGRGAIVSELPMRTAVLAGSFPTRNRIISGLSLGVLVVEAARRSGSLITARLAAEQGRAVFAVPGRVDSPSSQGVNELIRDGATLVQNLDDVLAELGHVGAKMAPEAADVQALPQTLDATESKLANMLSDGPLTLDELAQRSGLDSGRVASSMTMLVLKGVAVQRPGNVFDRRRSG
ncbi:MAG TPA: DNA-processing protein DprA [Phycisphaerae bacterium]|nr:DNA-processing protein DprA [Phycisphaerae bacterium]